MRKTFARSFLQTYTLIVYDSFHFRPVLPSVEPGYLHTLLPTEVPEQPEQWQDVIKDLDRVIMPGITNWQSPNFHAYYPTQTSYPSIVGEMIAASFGIVGFSWVSSDVQTHFLTFTIMFTCI